jgi:predicted acetyltransferase
MTLEIRPIRPEEFEAYERSNVAAFSGSLSDEELEDDRTIAEHDRQFAAFDGEEIVGSATAVTFRMTVPGGRGVATGGVPGVGVLPTHRRRGINTALFRAQLDDMHARGESISALHVSEAGIYGGFGFGVASFLAEMSLETARSAFASEHQPQGRVRLLARDQALPLMRGVYDAVVPTRAGMMDLNDAWFRWRFGESASDKEMPLFFAVHETDGGVPDAYAVYKVKHDWPRDIPRNQLMLRELMATTPQATADIWRFVFDIDLIHTVQSGHLPSDDPLLWLIAEPRRLHFLLSDGLWIRLVDVPAALAARTYAEDGRVVLDVADTFCPWNDGRYALRVSGGEATCAPSEDPPDVSCRVNELASTYLGGVSFASLAMAGRVVERSDGGLARADALFRSEPAPWCSLPF